MKTTKSFHSVNKFGAVKFFILFLLTFLITTSCDLTDPKKDNPKPEGYQEDIPWPSLADSPWPMHHGNPQSNGRIKFNVLINGSINWEFKNPNKYIVAGVAISSDSLIYVVYENEGLVILDKNGNEKQKFSGDFISSQTTPLITYLGDIIFFTLDGVYSVKKSGVINWKFDNSGQKSLGANIDKEGNIYYLNKSSKKLIVLNSLTGEMLWEYFDNRFNGNSVLTISPDGKNVYLNASKYLFAFDISTKDVKWTYQDVFSDWNFIDSQGNIYFIAESPNNNEKFLFTSLNQTGNLRWSFNFMPASFYVPQFAQATIDRQGNVYFVSDTLFSISFNGKLNWKKKIDGKVVTPLICDNYNIYYEEFTDPGSFNFIKIDNKGNAVFEIKNIQQNFGESPAIGFNQIIIPSGNDENVYSVK
jgi:hypothetical protein